MNPNNFNLSSSFCCFHSNSILVPKTSVVRRNMTSVIVTSSLPTTWWLDTAQWRSIWAEVDLTTPTTSLAPDASQTPFDPIPRHFRCWKNVIMTSPRWRHQTRKTVCFRRRSTWLSGGEIAKIRERTPLPRREIRGIRDGIRRRRRRAITISRNQLVRCKPQITSRVPPPIVSTENQNWPIKSARNRRACYVVSVRNLDDVITWRNLDDVVIFVLFYFFLLHYNKLKFLFHFTFYYVTMI